MNLLAAGIDSLRDDLQRVAAEDVLYTPAGAGQSALPHKAIVGKTVFAQTAPGGTAIRTETRDFIFAADGFEIEPRRGDRIAWSGRVWEVQGVGGEPVWRWSDPQHRALRVHAKLVLGRTQQ